MFEKIESQLSKATKWETLFDGNPYSLSRGKDFCGEPEHLVSVINDKAQRMGKVVQVEVLDRETIAVRART